MSRYAAATQACLAFAVWYQSLRRRGYFAPSRNCRSSPARSHCATVRPLRWRPCRSTSEDGDSFVFAMVIAKTKNIFRYARSL